MWSSLGLLLLKVPYFTHVFRRDVTLDSIHKSFPMLWRLSLPRGRPLRTLILLTFTLAITYYLYNIRHHAFTIPTSIDRTNINALPQQPPPAKAKPLPCLSLPGIEDIVVIIKTSAAEIEQKLPDLLSSTLKCFPDYLIYSDYPENPSNQPILDALEKISPKLKSTHPDFDLYRRLQKAGPDTLADEEIWTADKTSRKLDKWKMLPILHSSFQKHRDKKKWFIFIDTKSHLFLSNLLLWLNTLDPTLPFYLNVQNTQNEAQMLLDSGSFVLSHTALQAISEEYTSKQAAYEQITNERATGHSVLRHIVEKSRARTTSLQMVKSWPMFHSEKPSRLDYGEQQFFERLWCYPTVFYEGLSTGEIVELWKFEQIWIEMHQREKSEGKVLKHSDVFTEYILPRLTIRSGKVDDWDNFSGGFEGGMEAGSVEECMGVCMEREKCVQYAFKEGRCVFSEVPKMGEARKGVQSRWLLARVQKFGENMEKCTGDETWE